MWKRGNTNNSFDLIFSYLDLIFSDHGIFRLYWRSFSILPGKMIRSNQPFPFQLKKDIRKYKIKSVINLRGKRDCSSYYLEKNICKKHNLQLYNYPISSRDLPSKEKVLGFFKLLDTVQYPCIMHCKSGADRAGLASALYMIYKNKCSVDYAKQQLSFRHLHIKYAKTGILDYFFDSAIKENKNNYKDFIYWIKNEYNKDQLKKNFNYKGFFSFFVENILKRE